MNLCLNLLDKLLKKENENNAIGIILCTGKNEIEVEMALKNVSNPIVVAKYNFEEKKTVIKRIPQQPSIFRELLKSVGIL